MSNFPKDLCFPLRTPLTDKDNENRTYGCRHSNPDICGYCYLDSVCAFCTSDNICSHPSAKWKKTYKELLEAAK